jgi:hypothetical protein
MTARQSGSSERGKPASFDPRTGEAKGSGARSGKPGDAVEDYDSDLHDGVPGPERLPGPGKASS